MNILIMKKKFNNNEIHLRIKEQTIFEIVELHDNELVRIINKTTDEEQARRIYSSI